MSFNVVFEGTGGDKSNHPGIRTWTSFETEAHFTQWLVESGHNDVIVAKGISKEDAIKLTHETTGQARALAAFLSALEGSNLEHELRMAAWAATEEGHQEEFLAEVERLARSTEYIGLILELALSVDAS